MDPDLAAFKSRLRARGYERAAILRDDEFAGVIDLVKRDPRCLMTPPEELRYIEGLLALPFGHLEFFGVVPSRSPTCSCGRRLSALDLISHAIKHKTHDRELIRDTLHGLTNVFELADGGRTADCLACGRPVTAETKFTRDYVYV